MRKRISTLPARSDHDRPQYRSPSLTGYGAAGGASFRFRTANLGILEVTLAPQLFLYQRTRSKGFERTGLVSCTTGSCLAPINLQSGKHPALVVCASIKYCPEKSTRGGVPRRQPAISSYCPGYPVCIDRLSAISCGENHLVGILDNHNRRTARGAWSGQCLPMCRAIRASAKRHAFTITTSHQRGFMIRV